MGTMLVKWIPEWAVIRLPDGRLGIKGRGGPRKGRLYIELDKDTGTSLSLYEEVEVVAYPVQCARIVKAILEGEDVDMLLQDQDLEMEDCE
jgi:hypothetical protein